MRTGNVNLQAVRARVDRLAEQCRENHRAPLTLEDIVAGANRDQGSASDPPSDEYEETPPGSLEALICGTPPSGTTHAG